jgi:DNA sulfur modification protein DndD
VILDEIVLQDYGAFAGRQTVPLTPRDGRPVVVVGALNGSGKTTLLEAIQLALFGPLASPASRRGLSYEAYLSRAIHHRADPGRGAAVEILLRAYVEHEERTYRIRRGWRQAGGRIRDDLQISVDGRGDPGLAEAWTEHVETLVPRGIAGLFFFDGEQIEEFADLEASRDLLRTAIGGLLGLDLVDRLVGDLDLIERRRRADVASGDIALQLEAVQTHLDQLAKSAEEARRARDRASADLEQAHRRLAEVEEKRVHEGGRAYEKRFELEKQLQETRDAVTAARTRLLDAVAEQAPLLLVPDLLQKVAAHSHRELEQENSRLINEVLTGRDQSILDLLTTLAPASDLPKPMIQEVARWMRADRDRRSEITVDPWLQTAPETLVKIDQLLDGGLQATRTNLAKLVASFEDETLRAVNAERDLDAVPHDDVIQDLDSLRTEARAATEAADRALRTAESVIAATARDQERTMVRRRELLQGQLAEGDTRRFIEHSAKARDTLVKLRVAAAKRHADRIQAEVLEACQTLFHKSDLIADIRIDPATYALTLIASDGRTIETGSLSAGERQLFAVALLWGLARAASRPLPVVIDTPLGRLDGLHRARFAEQYLPNAAHQVIVLATDTEVGEETLQRIEASVSHTLHLAQTADGTVVREGPLPLGTDATARRPTDDQDSQRRQIVVTV